MVSQSVSQSRLAAPVYTEGGGRIAVVVVVVVVVPKPSSCPLVSMDAYTTHLLQSEDRAARWSLLHGVAS